MYNYPNSKYKRKSIKKLYDKEGVFFAEFYYHQEYFTNYSKHSHETFGLTLLDIGEIEVEFHLQDKQYILPNRIILFNPNQVHQTKSITKKSFGYYGLHISLQWCINIQNKLFGINKEFINIKKNIIDDELIYKDLKKIFNNLLENEELISSEELENYIIDVLKEYTLKIDSDKNIIKENDFLDVLEKYILDNLDEQITLKDLSLEVGYTESYISRIFKKRFGLTPHAYIVNKKVNRAKNKLLNSQNINIANLSNELGFYDQSHLNKFFKRSYAVSPNKYTS